MPENPLLPNARLKELYALMQRCRALDTKSSRKPAAAREAMLAAAAIHLAPGDLLCPMPGDTTAEALAPAPRANELAEGKSVRPPASSASIPGTSRLALCAAMAKGLQAAATGGLVITFANATTSEPGWPEALAWAQHSQAPLLLLCSDTTARSAASNKPNNLTWPALCKAAAKLKLPVLPVDGEDAVAVYRVVQECSARARMGEGPAVIWCLLSAAAKLTRSAQPLARMESYLAVRGLLPAKTAKKSRRKEVKA